MQPILDGKGAFFKISFCCNYLIYLRFDSYNEINYTIPKYSLFIFSSSLESPSSSSKSYHLCCCLQLLYHIGRPLCYYCCCQSICRGVAHDLHAGKLIIWLLFSAFQNHNDKLNLLSSTGKAVVSIAWAQNQLAFCCPSMKSVQKKWNLISLTAIWKEKAQVGWPSIKCELSCYVQKKNPVDLFMSAYMITIYTSYTVYLSDHSKWLHHQFLHDHEMFLLGLIR